MSPRSCAAVASLRSSSSVGPGGRIDERGGSTPKDRSKVGISAPSSGSTSVDHAKNSRPQTRATPPPASATHDATTWPIVGCVRCGGGSGSADGATCRTRGGGDGCEIVGGVATSRPDGDIGCGGGGGGAGRCASGGNMEASNDWNSAVIGPWGLPCGCCGWPCGCGLGGAPAG